MKREQAETYDIHDLERLTGASGRTVRRWMAIGLVPRKHPGGDSRRYGKEHLLPLLLAKHWRGQGENPSAIVAEIRRMSLRDIEKALAAFAPPPAPPQASAPPQAPAPALARVERWSRVPLVPGLDLVLRDDAEPLVARLAAEIHEKYALRG